MEEEEGGTLEDFEETTTLAQKTITMARGNLIVLRGRSSHPRSRRRRRLSELSSSWWWWLSVVCPNVKLRKIYDP